MQCQGRAKGNLPEGLLAVKNRADLCHVAVVNCENDVVIISTKTLQFMSWQANVQILFLWWQLGKGITYPKFCMQSRVCKCLLLPVMEEMLEATCQHVHDVRKGESTSQGLPAIKRLVLFILHLLL